MNITPISRRAALAAIGALGLTGAATAGQTDIEVIIENLAPQNGTWQTPFWVGFHDGGFDYFNEGEAASMALERIAEDGNASFLDSLFGSSGNGSMSGVLGGGPIAPGGVVSMSFTLDGNDPRSRYFSFASMVIPSNDAFVGNDNPLATQIFDDNGNFIGGDFFITGAMVWDAGTEVNDELPMNTAFFGQMNPDTGDDENGVVHRHPGFIGSFGNPGGDPRILGDAMFSGADFTLPGYPIARITIVPTPGAFALLGLFAPIAARRRRRD